MVGDGGRAKPRGVYKKPMRADVQRYLLIGAAVFEKKSDRTCASIKNRRTVGVRVRARGVRPRSIRRRWVLAVAGSGWRCNVSCVVLTRRARLWARFPSGEPLSALRSGSNADGKRLEIANHPQRQSPSLTTSPRNSKDFFPATTPLAARALQVLRNTANMWPRLVLARPFLPPSDMRGHRVRAPLPLSARSKRE